MKILPCDSIKQLLISQYISVFLAIQRPFLLEK